MNDTTTSAEVTGRHPAAHPAQGAACQYQTTTGDRDARAASFAAYCGDNYCTCQPCGAARKGARS